MRVIKILNKRLLKKESFTEMFQASFEIELYFDIDTCGDSPYFEYNNISNSYCDKTIKFDVKIDVDIKNNVFVFNEAYCVKYKNSINFNNIYHYQKNWTKILLDDISNDPDVFIRDIINDNEEYQDMLLEELELYLFAKKD